MRGSINGRSLALGAALLVISSAAQLALILAVPHTHFSGPTRVYSQMADRFLHGHLSLGGESGPDAFQPDPDWVFSRLDASPYHGQYYYYWGPAPAALLAGACKIVGVAHPNLGDEYISLAFAVATEILAVLLIFQIRARFFPNQPLSIVGPAILSLALGTPMVFSLGNPAIYEAAILAGQCFLLAGMLAAWHGLKGERPRRGLLALAGACWALAAGSRVSLPLMLIVLAGITIMYICRGPDSPLEKCKAAAALGLPMIIGFALLGWYNYVRFDSILESGEAYQLNRGHDPGIWVSGFISPANWIPNLIVYLFMPPAHLHGFPYLLAVARQPWLGGAFAVRQRLVSDPVVGLAWTQPFLILGILAIPWRRTAASGRPLGWLRMALLAGAFVGLLPPLSINFTAVRYQMDGVPCLSILGAIGYFSLLQWTAHRPGLAAEIRAAAWTMAAVQCVIAIALAIGRNPDLAHRLALRLPIL